jgi:hypothetical protein
MHNQRYFFERQLVRCKYKASGIPSSIHRKDTPHKRALVQ